MSMDDRVSEDLEALAHRHTRWQVGDRVQSRLVQGSLPGTVVEIRVGDGELKGIQVVTYRRDDHETHVALGAELQGAIR
jgi:hypothetical protein